MSDLRQTEAATSGASVTRRASSAPGGPRRRRRVGWALATVGAVLLGALVLAVALARTAGLIDDEAAAAKTDLTRVKAALAAGDETTAQRAQASASRHLARAGAAADTWSVDVARRVPVLSGAVRDLDHLLAAADHVTSSSAELVTAYKEVTGGARPLVRAGRVDLTRLPVLRRHVGSAAAGLRAAEQELSEVDGDLPGLSRVAETRDATLGEVRPARRALDRADVVLGRLPAALGAERAKRYLLAISNESELRASGGAPLSVTVLTLDDGVISSSPSVQAEDLPSELSWHGVPGSPFNQADGMRTDRFANASFHPDFRTAARDLMGAARAAGFPRLAGVVSVDVRAVSEVLRVTGPLPSPAYGDVTADNVGQKLLVDAYATYADDQDVRQGLNDELRTALLGRLLAGEGTVPVLRALGDSARGRHVQVFSTDPVLEDEITALGGAGAVRTGRHDVVGVFSQNGNGSKVDVFQRRDIRLRARVAADGSARVTQTVDVVNDVPSERKARRGRFGYLTGWSRNAYFVYLPDQATSPRLSSPTDGFAVDPFGAETWIDDGHGQRLGRVVGALPPGAEGRIELSYRLPAGAFTDTEGNLLYRGRALAQPLWRPAALQVEVTGPGIHEDRTLRLDRDREIAVAEKDAGDT